MLPGKKNTFLKKKINVISRDLELHGNITLLQRVIQEKRKRKEKFIYKSETFFFNEGMEKFNAF